MSGRNGRGSGGVGQGMATGRGHAKNKDQLGSDRARRMSVKLAARQDQYGSEHNEDQRVREQRRKGRPDPVTHNLAFRESAQDSAARRRQLRKARRIKSHQRSRGG